MTRRQREEKINKGAEVVVACLTMIAWLVAIKLVQPMLTNDPALTMLIYLGAGVLTVLMGEIGSWFGNAVGSTINKAINACEGCLDSQSEIELPLLSSMTH
ncbi:MAG: hypothetical protein QM752_01950 [Gammaproteobacteria bacterium]